MLDAVRLAKRVSGGRIVQRFSSDDRRRARAKRAGTRRNCSRDCATSPNSATSCSPNMRRWRCKSTTRFEKSTMPCWKRGATPTRPRSASSWSGTRRRRSPSFSRELDEERGKTAEVAAEFARYRRVRRAKASRTCAKRGSLELLARAISQILSDWVTWLREKIPPESAFLPWFDRAVELAKASRAAGVEMRSDALRMGEAARLRIMEAAQRRSRAAHGQGLAPFRPAPVAPAAKPIVRPRRALAAATRGGRVCVDPSRLSYP